jgi:hypothetical protein
MSITKNLVVGVSEDTIGGDIDALLLKTTKNGSILIEVAVPKLGVKLDDLFEAIDELNAFIIKRDELIKLDVVDQSIPAIVEESLIAPIPTFEFGEAAHE